MDPSTVVRGRENPSMEEKKANAEIGAINVSKEIGKGFELGFHRHERVEGILSKEGVLLKDGVKKVRQRGSVRGGGRRNAVKKGTRVGSFPNPDGSKRKRARTIRISMEAREGPT